MKSRLSETIFAARYRLIANAVGGPLYIIAVSKYWGDGCLEEGNPADGLYDLVFIFPILLVCLVLNISWLVKLMKAGLKRKDWSSFPVWLFVFIAWIIVMLIDNANEPPICPGYPN